MQDIKQREYYLFAGSYASSEKIGIQIFLFEPETGQLRRHGGVTGVDNPSFLALDAQRDLLFAVSETDGGGAIVSYRFDPKTGVLSEINRQPTLGDYPCHLSIDASGRWLFTVNYMTGSICVFPIQNHGAIGELTDFIQHSGHSIRSDRQEGPHPHSIVNIPNTYFWLVPDLGTDHIVIYRHDVLDGKLYLNAKFQTAAGSGPRHVAFHPSKPFVYVIEELSSTVTAYSYDSVNGSLTFMQTVSTLPKDFEGESTCADIHITSSGHYLYGSNRGHDSIAAFRISEDGKLETLGFVATMGKTPRNFVLVDEDKIMLIANQDTSSIDVFKISETGMPISIDKKIEMHKPVCLKILPVSSFEGES